MILIKKWLKEIPIKELNIKKTKYKKSVNINLFTLLN